MCAHRMLLELCVTPPHPLSSRVGAGRGRAIPLAVMPSLHQFAVMFAVTVGNKRRFEA